MTLIQSKMRTRNESFGSGYTNLLRKNRTFHPGFEIIIVWNQMCSGQFLSAILILCLDQQKVNKPCFQSDVPQKIFVINC